MKVRIKKPILLEPDDIIDIHAWDAGIWVERGLAEYVRVGEDITHANINPHFRDLANPEKDKMIKKPRRRKAL